MKLLILNLGRTKDGVGGKRRGNLRHGAAVRGGGLFHLGEHAELVTALRPWLGCWFFGEQPENNHIKDQSYNVVQHYFLSAH